MHHALAIADDAVVLLKGEVAYSGPVSELGDLQARLLGGDDVKLGAGGCVGPNMARWVTCARVVDDLVALGAHLPGERVVVEPLEHRDERDRGDRRVEVGRRDLPRCAR